MHVYHQFVFQIGPALCVNTAKCCATSFAAEMRGKGTEMFIFVCNMYTSSSMYTVNISG